MDFTAPIVTHTIDIKEFWLAFTGLLNPEAREAQLSINEPYDRNRIPVVFVHGPNSHPRMWRDVINDLRADPDLRGRYQFWAFYYPTGSPIAYSALRLREELATLDQVVGPQHHMVFIGHSMGGLLSRMQVISPDRAIWDAQFGKDASHLYATLPADSLVRRALVFSLKPGNQPRDFHRHPASRQRTC
jgi:pimeloyl-ACP methyl ester carboxylesterase